MSVKGTENMAVDSTFGLGKKQKIKPPVTAERRSLHTIQPSIKDGFLARPGEKLRNGKDGKKFDAKSSKIASSSKPVTVFEDPALTSTDSTEGDTDQTTDGAACSCSCHEKTEEEEALEFMTKETTAEEWRDLAEQRREALEESLIENQQLHFEVGELNCSVGELKSTVSSLREEMEGLTSQTRRLSQQRDYFANMLQELMDEAESGASSSDSAVCEPAVHTDSGSS